MADTIAGSDATDAMRLVAELRTSASTGRGEARRIAAAFPITHANLEVRASLAELALRLAAFRPKLPTDDDAAMRPRWDAAACAADSSLAEAWSGNRVLRALRFLRPSDVAEPSPIIARLAHMESSDAVRALEWARACVVAGSLEGDQALALLEPMSQHESVGVRGRFFDALAEPWLALTDTAALTRRALADPDVAVVRRALSIGAIEPESARTLRGRPELRVEVDLALARVGDGTDLAESLGVREAVLAHHRAGRFPRPSHVPQLLESYLRDHEWSPAELARVLYTCRTDVLDELERMDPDDPRWRRLASLLSHVEGETSSGKHAGQLLADRIRRTENLDVAAALLRAATDCPVFDDEDALLEHLDELPRRSFAALMRHGSERSLPVVLGALRDPVAFGAARRQALDWCWMVASDRLALIAEHGADAWTGDQLARAMPTHAAAVERARSAARTATPITALRLLGSVIDVDPGLLSEPFRAAVRSEALVQRGQRPRDPATPTAAEQALHHVERRLEADGRRVTHFDDPEPGRLARALAVAWIADAQDDPRDLVLALGVLARHPIAVSQLRFVHKLWRHPSADVQRAAAEALMSCSHSEGLALSLSRLATTEDIRTQRQGLRAIEHFESQWAENEAVRGLESPNMNVKKAAASALAAVGTSRCLPAVVRWLGAYDNPGLRATLLRALDRIAGDAASALLLSAFERSDGRQRSNLLEAMQGKLGAEQLVSFSERTDMTLADACKEGDLTLASGTWIDVAARLHRARMPPHDEPPAIDVLVREGFSSERALAALDEDSPRLDAAIRSRLPEWARWAVIAQEPQAAEAARRVLRASLDLPPEQALALAGRARSLIDVRLALQVLERVAAHGDDWRLRAIELARALDLPANERWRALRSLRAVTTRDELESAIDGASAQGELRTFLEQLLPTTGEDLMALAPEVRRTRAVDLWERGAPSAARLPAPPSRESEAEPTLDDLLGGRLAPTDHATLARLAEELLEWPRRSAERRRAMVLVPHLPLHRIRSFVSPWLEEARRGSEDAQALLRLVPLEELLAHPDFSANDQALLAGSMAVDPQLARSMRVHRLGVEEVEAPPEPLPRDPLDELEGAALLLDYALSHRGREASRAVGRLGKLASIDHLRRVLSHKDSNPRTVALRWLRRLLSRDEYLELALAQLSSESDPHLRRSLLRSVARRDHPAAFPRVVALVLDPDVRLAREALEAVLRIGDPIAPHIQRALAQERPDRARRLRELLGD